MSALTVALEVLASEERAEYIRIAGLVQGVGFRPTVWRLAMRYGMRGTVANDGLGVSIHVCGPTHSLESFVQALTREAPPLSRVDHVERQTAPLLPTAFDFQIVASRATQVTTGIVADAATCAECAREIFDPFDRRYRYPFTNCTHCGPRLSIIEAIPYDRASTTMRHFEMCAACRTEYENPAQRRFHAQPIACHTCGPRAWLERADGAAIALDSLTTLDAVDAVCSLLQRGEIVAIKGLGGFQLACDATNEAAVARLRERKHRVRKPFALMARDLDVVEQYCALSEAERTLLLCAAAPIVLLAMRSGQAAGAPVVASDATGLAPCVAPSVAPGLNTLGFMLPNTPLHHLLLRRMARPIVMTSGNVSDEPQAIDNVEATLSLGTIANWFLMHNRDVARRVDDSVMRVAANGPCVLRRARGLAPATICLPPGFDAAPPVLALGAELKNSFCLVQQGRAIVSHHMGDLENAPTFADFRRAIDDYLRLFAHSPQIIAVDAHPDYLSGKLGRELVEASDRIAEGNSLNSLALEVVQHHHAHIAACLAENGVKLDTAQVIGVALDGLGFGADGTLWGGEFFHADYVNCKRLATFKPVAMLGGEKAALEPWRNTYAHLMAEMGWPRFAMNYQELGLFRQLQAKPRALLDSMLLSQVNSPLASSCGRLFDAVAAATGVCFERVMYEGQAATEFEALVDLPTLLDEDDELAYPFSIPRLKESNLPYIEPLGMWQALLGDLILGTPVGVISARFHKGLALAMFRMVDKLSRHESPDEPLKTVALSGGVFQNRVLLEQVVRRLESDDFKVLIPGQAPANDGGLSLGQAAVASARAIKSMQHSYHLKL